MAPGGSTYPVSRLAVDLYADENGNNRTNGSAFA